MYSDAEMILHSAEDHYLQASEIETFKTEMVAFKQRLETYEYLREQEIALFQPVADQLLEAFPNEDPKRLERVLKDWIAVMRYCAMAMLLNNPEFLSYRLLEWLTDIVQAHEMEAIAAYLYESLQANLQTLLSVQQLTAINPFLEQAQTTLLKSPAAVNR